MADENKMIDIEGLSHFKAKQDIENANKFKSKDDATDLKGAVRYDTAQVLSPEEKEQARKNIGIDLDSLGSGGGTGVSDYNELLNRPVYCDGGYSYFDGNETPDPDTVSLLGGTFYKVSDLTPNKEQMFSADMFFNGYLEEEKLSEANILASSEKDGETAFIVFAVLEGERIIAVVYTTETVEGEYQGQAFSVTAPSTGIYWALASGVENKTFAIEYGEIKRLDDIYIPKNIPRLDESGVIPARNIPLIPAEKLPSYVDDVVEGYLSHTQFGDIGMFHESYTKDEAGVENWGVVISPETGKIYLDLLTNNTYRWSGSQYVRINPDEYTVATNADIDALFT